MRNLKKLLALVLALMMVLSVMVTVNAADVSDLGAENADYSDAVKTLLALDVFQGKGTGKFDPEAMMSRAEFATILYRLKSGDVAGENVSKYAEYVDFDDVQPTNWYAGYVDFVSAEGIMVGNGNGKFLPNNTIGNYEVELTLLRMLGYGQSGEFDTNWQNNAYRWASKEGVLNVVIDNGEGGAGAATRETVAQMIYNTLFFCKPVVYQNGASQQGDAGDLAEELLGLKKVDNKTDSAGRSVTQFTKGKNVVAEVANSEAVVTYTGTTTATTIDKDLDGYTFAYTDETTPIKPNDNKTNDKSLAVKVFKNGDSSGNALGTTAGTEKPDEQIVALLTGNNVTVEIYANDKKNVTDIVVIEYKADKVAENDQNELVVNTDTEIDTAKYDVAKDDVVVYTLGQVNGETAIASLVKLDGVKGTLERYTNGGVYTVNGTDYEIFGNTIDNPKTVLETEDALNTEYTYYIYDNYIVYVDAENAVQASPERFGMITSIGLKKTETTATWPATGKTTVVTAQIQVATTDGTIAIYDLPLTNVDGTALQTGTVEGAKEGTSKDSWTVAKGDWVFMVGDKYYCAVKQTDVESLSDGTGPADFITDFKEKLVEYTVNEKNEITLSFGTSLGSESAADLVIDGGPNTDAIKANDSQYENGSKNVALNDQTVFVYVKIEDDGTKTAASTVTGVANLVAQIDKANIKGAVVESSDEHSKANYVARYVFVNTAAPGAQVAEEVVYATGVSNTTVDGTVYEAYTVDGEKVWLKVEDTKAGPASGTAGIWKLNTDGDLKEQDSSAKKGAYTKTGDNSIKVGSDYLNVASGAVVVPIGDLELTDGCTVAVVTNAKGEVIAIFVTAAAAA